MKTKIELELPEGHRVLKESLWLPDAGGGYTKHIETTAAPLEHWKRFIALHLLGLSSDITSVNGRGGLYIRGNVKYAPFYKGWSFCEYVEVTDGTTETK